MIPRAPGRETIGCGVVALDEAQGSGRVRGSVTVKVEPEPGSLVTVMLPRWARSPGRWPGQAGPGGGAGLVGAVEAFEDVREAFGGDALAGVADPYRTNLFRLRYWIAFLSPLAALAALGIVSVATAAARLVRRVPLRSGRWMGRGIAGLAVVLMLGLQVGVTLQPQEQVRALDGHSENLSTVLVIVAEAQAAHPGLVTAITSATASGMLAAADPTLLAGNPMRRLDPAAATVYTSVTPASVIRGRLLGAHDILWIHRGPESPAGAVRLIPHVLAKLHPTVLWARAAGTGWTAVLLKLPRGSA